MNVPTSPNRSQLTERLVVELGAAFQQRAVYAHDHPQVERALARTVAAFEAWRALAGTNEVSLILLEDQLIVEHQALPEDAMWGRGLLQAFHRYEIRGLSLLSGLSTTELGRFLDAVQAAKGATSTRHIAVGQAGYAASDGATEGSSGPATSAPASWLSSEQFESGRAELVAMANGAATRVDRLRSLVARLARSAEEGALAPLRLKAADANDRAFLHGLSVALGTLRLGRALRLDGVVLEELALAALVHDVGYLEPGAPDGDPGARRRSHPVRGAARLSALEGMPDLAVLVAYEHHLRFDGEQNYPRMAVPRQPVAAARIVAVADTWETLRGQGDVGPEDAIATLRARAGTYLDPALVELFAALVLPQPS
ncbi:MAG: HD domain-containing phosphohydrolase [Thermoanaerobaculia bacterium]